MALQTIHFGDEGQLATRELLRRADALAPLQLAAHRTLRAQLATLDAIDRQHGGTAPLELEDAPELVAAIVTQLAHWETDAHRRELAAQEHIAFLIIGTALWAIRHEVDLRVVEPVANALAWRSNRARTRQEIAAVYGLMQGVIAHVAPRLAPDLERSNPERPWRVLHANFAITAIRTQDPALIDFAFDALDDALPAERANFYGEALALALAPGIAPAVRERIERRHRKWALGR
jgi:hypothetical protein